MEEISSISGATLDKARRELNEDPDRRLESILELRDKINDLESDPSEPNHGFLRKDDKFLLCFLRARKFDISRSLQLYVNYHKYRNKYSDLLQDYNVKSLEGLLRSGVFGVLDQRLNDGSKVVVLFPGRYNVDQVPFTEIFKALLLIIDRLIEDEETQVHGISVFDCLDGVSLGHTLKIARSEHVQKAIVVELIQEAFPGRFKGAHLFRQPWYISLVFNIVRPFLKQKFKDRIHMHGWGLDSVKEFINPDQLPEEFGGSLPKLTPDSVTKLFPELASS